MKSPSITFVYALSTIDEFALPRKSMDTSGSSDSPILYGGYIYLISDKGMLTCVEAKTGNMIYEGARVPVPASFFSSPVAFADKLLITSDDGDTFVVKAGPKHEIIRTNSLGEPVFTTPALANGRIYIRGEKNLYCISNGEGK